MIRPVKTSDAASISAIFNHYIEHTTTSFETVPVSISEMGKRISDISSYYPYLVYEDDEIECGNPDNAEHSKKVLGYAYAHAWKERSAYAPTAEITIYLNPEVTGRGIGKKLMSQLIEECTAQGLHSLIACITAENEPSIRFHESFGFKQASLFRQVGYKFNRFLDVVDMQLIILPQR